MDQAEFHNLALQIAVTPENTKPDLERHLTDAALQHPEWLNLDIFRGATVLQMLAAAGRFDMLDAIAAHAPLEYDRPNEDGCNTLHEIIKNGGAQHIPELLKRGITDLHSEDNNGHNAMCHLLRKSLDWQTFKPVAEAMLDRGFDLGARDRKRRNVYQMANQLGQVANLIRIGADVYAHTHLPVPAEGEVPDARRILLALRNEHNKAMKVKSKVVPVAQEEMTGEQKAVLKALDEGIETFKALNAEPVVTPEMILKDGVFNEQMYPLMSLRLFDQVFNERRMGGMGPFTETYAQLPHFVQEKIGMPGLQRDHALQREGSAVQRYLSSAAEVRPQSIEF